jgi:signal transduction histidine kinase
VHYNLAGGQIKIETGTNAGQAYVSVANSGPTVPPDQVDKLFEPFQRGGTDATDNDDDHHGLGLSIVRAIATTHDAALAAQTRPEGGLAVTARFPALRNTAHEGADARFSLDTIGRMGTDL